MTIVDIDKDLDNLTISVAAEYDAPIAAVWQLWADPRKLERWWGPPTYPATFVEHDLAPGGRMAYFMTSPEGEKYHGWWRVVSVDEPTSFEVEDGFGDDDGNENREMPVMRMRVRLGATASGGTRMDVVSTYDSTEAMEKVLEMGVIEGMSAAMGQIDAILASSPHG